MLYWLLFQVLYTVHAKQHSFLTPLRLFQYVTFRTAFASLTALFLSIIIGPWMIQKLREFAFGQYIREEGPAWHAKKSGTPTMGGLLTVTSIIIPTLLWADLRNPYVWIAMFALVSFGGIGLWDDWTKVAKKRNLGLTSGQKFLAQVAICLAIGVMLLRLHAIGAYETGINVPFVKQFHPDLLISSLLASPWTYPLAFIFFFPFMILVIAGASNAVNLTDGL